MDISTYLQSKQFTVKKPTKNAERNYYIDRLAEITSYSKRGIVFSFAGLPDSWLKDAIRECENYSDIKARTYFLKEFLKKIKQ
jgi:hypothetical protein